MSAALYELYDSDNPLSIPLGVRAAGYDDGYAATAWAAYGWARFPEALHISIYGNPGSDIFDIESGGGSPSQAAPWALERRSRGRVGITYVNRANGHLVEQYLRNGGLGLAEVMLWVATDDGTQTVTVWDDGTPVYYPVWAVQYLNQAHGSGGHYDRSLVYLAFGGGGGILGGVNPSEKYLAIRTARAAGQGPDVAIRKADGSIDVVADDAYIVSEGDRILDDGSNADAIGRQFFDPTNPVTAKWMQIVADLKAGKYLTSDVDAPATIPPGTPITFTGTATVSGTGTTK